MPFCASSPDQRRKVPVKPKALDDGLSVETRPSSAVGAAPEPGEGVDSPTSPIGMRKQAMKRGMRYGAAADRSSSRASTPGDEDEDSVSGNDREMEMEALGGSRPSTADSTTSNTSTASIPPPQWHLTTQKYMTCLPVTVFMLLVTMWALFGADIQAWKMDMSADPAMEVIAGTLFVIFMIELALNSLTLDKYFLCFFFWLDLIAALSMLLDIKAIKDSMSSDAGEQDLTWARAGRAARAGTRAGKMLKLTRVLRLFRVIKLFRMLKRDNNMTDEEQIDAAAGIEHADGVGSRISEVITNKVVLMVLVMLLVFPLLEFYPVNQAKEYGLKVLDADLNPVTGNVSAAAYLVRYKDLLRLDVRGGNYVTDQPGMDLLRPDESLVVCVATHTHPAAGGTKGGGYKSTCALFDAKEASMSQAVYGVLTTAFVILVLSLATVALGKETTAFAEGICTPLQELSEDVDRILHFKYFLKAREEATSTSTETKPKKENKYAHSFEVIKSMQDQFGRMAAGLQAFSKFVPEKVVRKIVQPGEAEAVIHAVPCTMSYFFCDIQGFTTICERLEPMVLHKILSEFFKEMSAIITASGGTLIEYIGDAILAVWNAPDTILDHEYVAAIAVSDMQAKLKELRPAWEEIIGLPVLLRTGLHTGPAFAGYLGSESRMKYGVFGAHAAVAAHLEEINKGYGSFGLISEGMYAHEKVQDTFLVRCVDMVLAEGVWYDDLDGDGILDTQRDEGEKVGPKQKPFRVYETLGKKTEGYGSVEGKVRFQELEKYAQQHDKAMDLYLARDFKGCIANVEEMRVTYSEGRSGYMNLASQAPWPMRDKDMALEALFDKATHFIEHPPAADWDGTFADGH